MLVKQWIYYGQYDYDKDNIITQEYPFYYNSPTKMQDWILKIGDLWNKNGEGRMTKLEIYAPIGTKFYLNNQNYPVTIRSNSSTGYGHYKLNIQEGQELVAISFDRYSLLDIGYYNANLIGLQHKNEWKKIIVQITYQ